MFAGAAGGSIMELIISAGLFIALTWVIAHAALIFLRADTPQESAAAPIDPISTYVDENYGSHFVEDPVSVNRSMRRL
jgi:hypothetical protein